MDHSIDDNLLLAGLPAAARGRIARELEPVDLPRGQVIARTTGMTDRFHFITGGLVSLLYETADEESAEVAIVGREGGISLSLVLGGRAFPARAVVQVPGSALALSAECMRREFEDTPALRRALLCYTQALMTQMAQTAVCNRHHSIEQQLCRWILLSLDRLATNRLEMTQGTIAHMLGVRRAGVSEAVARLAGAGLVEHRRGRISVTDRAGLQARVCECYGVVRRAYAHLEHDLAALASDAGPDAR